MSVVLIHKNIAGIASRTYMYVWKKRRKEELLHQGYPGTCLHVTLVFHEMVFGHIIAHDSTEFIQTYMYM